ncbi:MAG: ATP-dependent zinc metalloprotease FtsH [Deltaproteobacteria bacterium]|nr:ATP-dependent zinc metalloprotease FtsH [Deltaproteobacteria bacterium]
MLWVLIGVLMLFVIVYFQRGRQQSDTIPYSQFMTEVQTGNIDSVEIKGPVITGRMKDGKAFDTYGPTSDFRVSELLAQHGVNTRYVEDGQSPLLQILIQGLPLLLLIAIMIFFMRQMSASGGKAMSFGKSKARMLSDNQNRLTFSDVAGCDEAKEELEEIIAFLKDPKKFTKLSGRIPKGVLLMGPPGTGKTLLAKAVAGEAGVPFFSISGSDFVEMFVGVGASRVRDLFAQGKKNAPCIIFIDEIDAVGRYRGAGFGGGNDEREQTLNMLLVEMDGFESNEGVIIIAATNRPDVLDPALLRAGRFDRRVVVSRPDVKGREEILRVHTKKVPIGKDVDLSVIARGTPGYVGADLENLVNEAALLAARRNKDAVYMEDLEEAKDKVLMGRERKSALISEKDKRVTAYHEAGHALVALRIEGSDPVHKVTIIPRGMALGLTMQLPEEDRLNYNKEHLEGDLAILMGGRLAEQIVLKNITTGASNDLERATALARKMVCEWGMSDRLGPVTYGHSDDPPFMGLEMQRRQNYSEATAIEIDNEVRGIIQRAYDRAKTILEENIDVLHRMANYLIERETLDMKEVKAIAAGEELPPMVRAGSKPEQKAGTAAPAEPEAPAVPGIAVPDPVAT